MLVRDVMHTPVVATTPEASARDVATELAFHRFTGMPVNDHDGHVVGIVSEADVLSALLDGRDLADLTIADIMTDRPITVKDTDDVTEVLELLQDHRILRLPVTRNGKLVGIIARIDLIRVALHEGFEGF